MPGFSNWPPMIELLRTVRFCLSPARRRFNAGATPGDEAGCNTFAGWPTLHGLGTFYELDVECRGKADPLTGYFMNITEIDQAVRQHALPIIEQAYHDQPEAHPGAMLPSILRAMQPSLRDSIIRVRWRLSPYHSFMIDARQSNRVAMTESFEFAAAHRLHCPTLSADENQSIFGKCNNPNGHGHNYILDVTVSKSLDQNGGFDLSPARLEAVVKDAVIDRFDHKHLNLDTTEFAGRNPSVEVIAEVCYGLLVEPVAAIGGRLECVSVWETGKTRCTYPAEAGR